MNPTTEPTTAELTTTVDTHLDAYAEPDAARRIELIERVWNPAGTLADPPFAGRGVDEISALAATVVDHFPDHRFRRTTELDVHHGHARYGWELAGRDGAVAMAGIDVARFDDAGRLVDVVGFTADLVPAATTAA